MKVEWGSVWHCIVLQTCYYYAKVLFGIAVLGEVVLNLVSLLQGMVKRGAVVPCNSRVMNCCVELRKCKVRCCCVE